MFLFLLFYHDIEQWKYELKPSKGTLLYENGKIKYYGDLINDKKEGKGALFYENGNLEYLGDLIKNLYFHDDIFRDCLLCF